MFKKGFFIFAGLVLALILSSTFFIQKAKASDMIGDYSYEIVSQSPYPSVLKPGDIAKVSLEIKNTGTETWENSGTKVVRLGSGSSYGLSSQQRDYDSEFYAKGWLSKNRPANITSAIKPGEISKFNFDIQVPASEGKYKAYFTPVVDGYKWMGDQGIYWEITVKNGSETHINTGSEKDFLFNTFAPSVVKLTCGYNKDFMSQGSGTLFYNSTNNPDFPKIYILTNLHVVKKEDASTSDCEIQLYPNSQTLDYITFHGSGHKDFGSKLDFAIIEPEIMKGSHAGTEDDLIKYSQKDSDLIKAGDGDIENNKDIYVLGYPGNGNITVSQGKFTGYETYEGSLFIDTSAVVKKGNSGGLALNAKGEMLGIPTLLRGNTGMILDIDSLIAKL